MGVWNGLQDTLPWLTGLHQQLIVTAPGKFNKGVMQFFPDLFPPARDAPWRLP
jgi:hypothetical protein